jgi:predicted Abi (CAAX) family protease
MSALAVESGQLADALRGILLLHASAFVAAVNGAAGPWLALAVVLVAGLSQALGQSVVLFANRVRAQRFVFSLAIDGVLFSFGYGFLVLSTWLVLLIPGQHRVTFPALAIVFGAGYAPLLFAFLAALPYLGRNLLWVLRIWHLLALVVGLATIANVSLFTALTDVGIGWVVLSIAAQTIGKPVAQLGERLLDAVAGIDVTSSEQLAIDRLFNPGGNATLAPPGSGAPAASGGTLAATAPTRGGGWKTLAGAGLIVAIGYVLAVTLAPLHRVAFGWQTQLPRAAQVPLDLLWIALLGVLVAGFMAPVETLGWWAGWFGDDVVKAPDASAAGGADGVSRYVVYLDGISQSSSRYMPDVEQFLDALGARLPPDMRLVRGVMTYSVLNRPLDDDPLLARFWTFVDRLRFADPGTLLGMIVNLRNVLIVAVSADERYGAMYNYGIAQLVYNALVASGYRLRSGVPVTLIGYSGGGQMSAACGAFVGRAIDAPVDVISLGGVISGSAHILDLEHLYHFTGTKDAIQRLGPIMFASRWKLAVFSNWNRAVRLGRLTQYSLGPVGHQVPGGMMDPNLRLPDGRTALEQTLQVVTGVLTGRITETNPAIPVRPSTYGRAITAAWNQPGFCPIGTAIDAARYEPIGAWLGRLILPPREARFGGVFFEVAHAPDEHAALIGTTVRLRWDDDPAVRDMVRAVTRDVHFSAQAQYTSRYGGLIHPVRLNHWQMVDPLESLAGSRPIDDVEVWLDGDVRVDDDGGLRIVRQPVQIAGRYLGLVRFVEPADADGYIVVHYDRATHAFDGPRETVRVPAPVTDTDDRAPSRIAGIEHVPLNDAGWYIFGAPDASGTFVVRCVGPRALLGLTPNRTLLEAHATHYLRHECWPELVARKGTTLSTQIGAAPWTVGDRALLVHTYGGIGGSAGEKAATGPIYFGHFAYGFAQVVADGRSGDARFDIVYQQVYTHNTDGLVAGRLHWSRYIADRQFGWLGMRPTCDLVLNDDTFSEPYTIGARRVAPLDALALHLDAMTARYRIGDGTGGTYVGAANNCAQDSNQALFAALRELDPTADVAPDERARFARLCALVADLRGRLAPFGHPRRDWSDNVYNLGSTLQANPLQQVRLGLGSWRVLLPRLASDTIAGAFLRAGARAWVLGTDQVHDRPELAPVVPLTL